MSVLLFPLSLLLLCLSAFVESDGGAQPDARRSPAPPDAAVSADRVVATADLQKLLAAECEHGGAWSCRRLADLLVTAKDTKRDERRAASLYERALALGHLNACHWGGLLYEQGSRTPGAVPRNYDKALQLYKTGCDRGSPECCADESAMYFEGKGVPKDRKRAAALLKRAEKLGFAGE